MNFRSQKGATGTDIIIAISVIVLSVAVVSMIYVNTTLQSRNVTRTAGATRIATNILENIEKMSYAGFVAEYNATAKWEKVESGNYKDYKKAKTGVTTFNTKIPAGYTVYLWGEPNYGSYTSQDEQFDLVREIKLLVIFSVGDMDRIVDFTTSKTREIVAEANSPDISVLNAQNIINSTKNYFPVKFSQDANAYMHTTEDDPEWYSYSNRIWAMVIVSTKTESQLFDVNGKLTASTGDYANYVWIPKFFTKTSGSNTVFSEFAYLSSPDQAIKAKQSLKAADTTTTLYYNTLGPTASGSTEPGYFTLAGNLKVTGKWVAVGQIDNQDESKILKASVYGPCELH